MKLICPKCNNNYPNISKAGHFFRASDSKKIQRFKCNTCSKKFSHATFSAAVNQNKRRLNYPIKVALASNMSMRRIALLHKISRTTVKRKLLFLSQQARLKHTCWLKNKKFKKIQFDDLETFEHTKKKPLTVSMAVEEKSRKIIGFSVSQIGPKGLLKKQADKKYGKRRNESYKAREELFKTFQNSISEKSLFKTDGHNQYNKLIKKYFPKSSHQVFKSRESYPSGLGELKYGYRDPLFYINHTFAMLRANLNRLGRRTWCTTKKQKFLEAHLWVYVDFHNSALT